MPAQFITEAGYFVLGDSRTLRLRSGQAPAGMTITSLQIFSRVSRQRPFPRHYRLQPSLPSAF